MLTNLWAFGKCCLSLSSYHRNPGRYNTNMYYMSGFYSTSADLHLVFKLGWPEFHALSRLPRLKSSSEWAFLWPSRNYNLLLVVYSCTHLPTSSPPPPPPSLMELDSTSLVKSTNFSFRGPQFQSWHPYWGVAYNSSSKGSNALFWSL